MTKGGGKKKTNKEFLTEKARDKPKREASIREAVRESQKGAQTKRIQKQLSATGIMERVNVKGSGKREKRELMEYNCSWGERGKEHREGLRSHAVVQEKTRGPRAGPRLQKEAPRDTSRPLGRMPQP